MRRVALFLFGLLVVGTLAVLFWPYTPQASVLPQREAGKGEQVLHLQMGELYEQAGDFEHAAEEYRQAITTDQNQATGEAETALARVFTYRDDPLLRLRAEVRAFLLVTSYTLVKLVLVGIIALVLWLLLRGMPHRKGYLLMPFHDVSGGNLGHLLIFQVRSTLQSVQSAYLHAASTVCTKTDNLVMPTFGILDDDPSAFTDMFKPVDILNVSGVNLPLGQIFEALTRWVALREYVIVGTIMHTDGSAQATAELRRGDGSVLQTWQIEVVEDGDDTVLALRLGEEMAFRLLHHLSPTIGACNWQSLMLHSKALRTLQRYRVDGGSLEMLEDAAQKLEAGLAIDPEYAVAKYNLGIIYSLLGRYDSAKELFGELQEDGGSMVLEASYNRGVMLYHKFQDWAYDHAERQFDNVLTQLEADHLRNDERVLAALAHAGLAAIYGQRVGRKEHSEEQLECARMHWKQALDLAGNLPEVQAAAYGAIGIAYMNAQHWDEAISALRNAICYNAQYPISYVYLADIYRRQGQMDVAFETLKRALRANPNYQFGHYRLGLLYRDSDERAFAQQHFEKASHIPDAHNELGKLLVHEGHYDEGLKEFRMALEINNRHSEALCNIAWYMIEAGRIDDQSLRLATEYARRSLQLEHGTPQEWHRSDVLGWVLMHRKLYQEAEHAFQVAQQKNMSKAQPRYHLALLYEQLGEIERARHTLYTLLEETKEKGHWREQAVAMAARLNN